MAPPRVPLLDLTRTAPDIQEELRRAFDRVLESGFFVLGSEVDAFERECAEWIGVRHALGVSSGTDALILALMASCIGPGDEVICPSYTFFATAGSIWRVGATPVFVDIDPVSFNCDPEDVARKLGPKTRAILPVHLYGQCAEMGALLELVGGRDIAIIEDAAQAIGARWNGRSAGSIGTFGCFSFFPTKNLGCLGDGGLVTTEDDDLANRARIMRVHGMEPKYYHSMVGGNFRIDALQAAFLRVKLPRLREAEQRRRANAARYRELFAAADLVAPEGERAPGRLGLPAELSKDHTYNQFVVRVFGDGARDALRATLTESGVGTEVYYPVPLHLQECFRSLGHQAGDFPESERAALETLALPIFPELRPDEIERVVSVTADWCARQS
jgi:dTDP-4-amino-4,6-dideoxygalactose transaminase